MDHTADLRLAANGDKQAFARLIAEREQRLYGLALAVLGSPQDAADALQNAVLQAYRSLSQLRHLGSFDAWLRQILVNEARGLMRRRDRAVPLTADDTALQASDPRLAAIEHHYDIASALATLTPETQLVLALRYYEDLSLREVAQASGLPVGTVKSRLHYALRRLRAVLSDGPAGPQTPQPPTAASGVRSD